MTREKKTSAREARRGDRPSDDKVLVPLKNENLRTDLKKVKGVNKNIDEGQMDRRRKNDRKRDGYYHQLYQNRAFDVVALTNKDGYLQAQDRKTNKKFGRPFKVDGETHHLLYRLFPQKFPAYKDFVMGANRLVKKEKRNFTRSFNAENWRNLGFETAKQGKEFVSKLRKNNIPFHTEDDIRKLMGVFRTSKEVINKNLERHSKYLSRVLKKNLGRFTYKKHATPLKNAYEAYEMKRIGNVNDIYVYLNNIKYFLHRKIHAFLLAKKGAKFSISIEVLFVKKNPDGTKKYEKGHFFSAPLIVGNVSQIASKIKEATDEIKDKVDKFIKNGSGWEIDKIVASNINLYRYTLTTGSSFFKLDKFLDKKVINIKNDDNRCFLYCLIVALHYDELDVKKLDRLNQFKKFFDRYDFDDADMPMCIDTEEKVRKYEDMVKRNITILYYENGTKDITPYYVSTNTHEQKIYLMLCHNPETKQDHFVYVRDLSRLLRSSFTKHDNKGFFCDRCLSHFNTQKALDAHIACCEKNEVSKVKMSKHEKLYFTNHFKMLNLPFVVYADFECLLLPTNEKKGSNTTIINNHKPCGAKYIIVSSIHDGVVKEFFNRSADCVRLMMEQLKEDCEELYGDYFQYQKEMEITEEEEEQHRKAETCHICGEGGFCSYEENKEYRAKNKNHPKLRVRDHDHFTGLFRGTAHSSCNLNYQVKKVFPVFFHNLKGYDSHFIINQFKKVDADNISIIPNNREKFISFSYEIRKTKMKGDEEKEFKAYEVRFIDSLSFLNSSLEKLAKNLLPEDFQHTREFIKTKYNNDNELFNLIIKKGVYCYEYMDDEKRFNETERPPKYHFISQLKNETKLYHQLNEKEQKDLNEDYEHFLVVWDKFNIKNMGEYHDLYLNSDVCLLADIFEKFRKMSLDKFKLDPAHYYTLPSMAWDAMLKLTGVKLQLFQEDEKEMYLMMESAKIGGISGTGGKRYAKANNKYLTNFDKTKTSNFIIYTDANGLYSYCETLKLPIDSFKWVEDFNLDEALKDVNGDTGYFVEGDFLIPDELHDYFNDYCPFPENIVVKENMISRRQKRERELLDEKGDSVVGKLIPNLMPKKRYTIHIKLLKLYIELGCKVEKIHRVLSFRQTEWMKPYIDMCMNERMKKGITEFEKDFWKLSCNAVYGKTMENTRNRCNVEILHDETKLLKMVQKPTFKGTDAINDEIFMVDMAKSTISLNKPIYVGVAVLNLAKFVMYDFYYNTLKRKYADVSMIYTDTDSFIFEVKTEDFYKDLLGDKEFGDKWDLSNYSTDHKMFDGMDEEEVKTLIGKNYKKAGFFKDETAGEPIVEVVGLRAKMYSLLKNDGKQKRAGKGIKSSVLEKIKHERYVKCLNHNFVKDDMFETADMTFIRSVKHKVHTETTTKITLCSYDDKKFIMDDGISQLSYGHYKIKDFFHQ